MPVLTEEKDILAELEAHAAAPPMNDEAAVEAALLNETINGQIDLDTVIPSGTYLAKIIEVTAKKSALREERDPVTHLVSKKGGNLYLNLKLQVLDGEFAGRFVWDMVMLTGKGSARMAQLASALGFYDKDAKVLTGFGTATPTAGMIKARILGTVVGIETEVEPSRVWQGKTQPPRAKPTFNGYFTPETPAGAAQEIPGWE